MKFVISSTALFSHLQAIGRVINSKNTLPILDCFLLELNDGVLSLTASDNETTMATSLEVNESDGNCRFAINAKTILDALKAVSIPAVEVHISDVDSREAFRQISYAGLACEKTIKGLGLAGYQKAIAYLVDKYRA